MNNYGNSKTRGKDVKKCTSCEEYKELSEYHNRLASKDGKDYRCKSCVAKAQKKYFEENEEAKERKIAWNRKRYAELDDEAKKKVAERMRQTQMYRRYGITTEQFEEMNAKQEGKCDICGAVETGALCIDHCHTSGNIRGLLCGKCNKALGLLGDTEEAVEKALLYLRKPPAIITLP